MNKNNNKGKPDDDILNMEILTPKEAREYIKEQLKIGDSYYYQCVLPEIRHHFKPIGNNYKRMKNAMLRVLKRDLDSYIRLHKKKLLKD